LALSSAPRALRSANPGFLAGQARKLILYIEDNPANVTFLEDLLSTFEIDLLTAVTAEAGVELARTRQPDAVVMDINLPGMSGLEALHALRSSEETKRIPVIALSAAASESDQQLGLIAGFDRYLTKPLEVDDFLTALEALFCAPLVTDRVASAITS
jgi:CheY-like chemotaxis protein